MAAAPVRFEGVFPILPTPFDDQEHLDLASFDRMIRFMVDIGVDGVTILGVLGEANRLVDAEREQLISTAVAAAQGRIPVIVGTSHPGTRATVLLSQRAGELGAAGVMITPSREPVPSEERIFEYFAQVAAAVDLPIVAQNHPASTQVHMSVPLLLRLVAELPSVACLKEEQPPTPTRYAALRAQMARPVPMLSGLGALYGLFDLEQGGNGFMTGFALPEVLMALTEAARAGRMEEAQALYERFLPLIVFEQQPGLGVRKEVFRLRGLLATNRVRHPGAQLAPAAKQQLDALLARTLPGVDLTKKLAL